MRDNTAPDRKTSFLTSSEGKKILFFTILLVFVVGMMLYSYYSTTQTSWSNLLRDTSFEEKEIIGSSAYIRILEDLQNIESGAFERKKKQQKQQTPDPSKLRDGVPDARGKIFSFKGRAQRRSIPIEPIPDSNRSVRVHELKLRNEEDNLTYIVHLIISPETPIKRGTVVKGDGVYLATASNVVSGKENGKPTSAQVYMLARTVEVVSPPETNQNTPSVVKNERTPSEPSPEVSETPEEPEPPKNYTNRETVTSYWNTLLSRLNDSGKINLVDPLFKRMVKELEKVKKDDLHSWTDSSIPPETLRDNPPRPNRGTVISFRGKHIQRYKKELFGGPQDRDVIWEYWIRDEKNHVTYTFYSFKKAGFDPDRGTAVQGTGVFLNKQTYELLEPIRAGDQTIKRRRTVVVLGRELNPFFTSPDSGQESTVKWVQYVLGGLIVLTLGIFLVMVYISLSGNEEDRAENLRKVRRRKPSPYQSDESSSENDPSSGEQAS